jgi:phosphotransferase system HPr (HPr) family protein
MIDLLIPSDAALHARPATALARVAGAHVCTVHVANLTNGRGPVDARSVLALLSLGATAGAHLRAEVNESDCADGQAVLQAFADEFRRLYSLQPER